MLKVPGISNLTFQNANKFGTQLFKGIDESGAPVYVSTKHGILYKVIKNVSQNSFYSGETISCNSNISALNYWTNLGTLVDNATYFESKIFEHEKKCWFFQIFLPATKRHPIREYLYSYKPGKNCLTQTVKKYNSIVEPMGHLTVERTKVTEPDGSYTLTTTAHSDNYRMPHGTLKRGIYAYTKTISSDGKVISNKRYNPHIEMEPPKRDVFSYDEDGRLFADQVDPGQNIATSGRRVNELYPVERYI